VGHRRLQIDDRSITGIGIPVDERSLHRF
jgi:hypothetical protein